MSPRAEATVPTGSSAGAPACASPDTRRTEVRLTPAVVVIVVLLGLAAGLRPAVASPTVTAVLWSGLATVAVVGVLWPLLDRRSTRILVRTCATDVVEGAGFGITLSLDRAGFPQQVRLDASVGSIDPTRSTGAPHGDARSGSGPLFVNAGNTDAEAVLTRRGVYTALPVQVIDTGPFGLLRVCRLVSLQLPAPLFVAPRAVPSGPLEHIAGSGNEPTTRTRVVMSGDTVRSVRPYAVGDPAHLVHWPTSAHTGELMVRELEPPAERLAVVVVDLRSAAGAGLSDPVEDAVRLAAGAVQRALDESRRVVLCTAQPEGPNTAEVHGITQMRRLLAAATTGPPGAAPEGCAPLVFTPAGPETSLGASEQASTTTRDAVVGGHDTGSQGR